MERGRKATVSLIPVSDYSTEAVESGLRRAMEPFGGMQGVVKPGDRVLLKANLLAPCRPEEAVTTHPEVVRAVIRLVREAGASRILVGDGPGVGTTAENMRVSGIQQVCDEEGAETAVFRETAVFETPENVLGKRLELTSHLLGVDVVITLPKLKTHVQTGYTGAIKNQYGLIPGIQKGEYHLRFQNRDRLADLMVDINRTARVKLAVMDAIVGMEGRGPHGGTPRKIGALVVGTDLPAVDVVCCTLIGLPPGEYPLLQAAARGRYGTTSLEEIEVFGAAVESLRVPDFKLVQTPLNILKILPLPGWILRGLRRQVAATPHIDRSKCIGCLKCHNGCPVKPPAIDPRSKYSGGVNGRTCIRCYCCHEFCPVDAIELRKPWAERIFHLTAIAGFGTRLLGKIFAFSKRSPHKDER